MTQTITITLVDGVKIVVPDSLDLITPYVLLEQQDWFEDEIKFLRQLLQAGQKVIDIGANYGTYSLSMANTIGLTGQVWAFEPASSTAKLFSESIAINGFSHITLDQSALSNVSGTARLSLNRDAEANALIHDHANVHSEIVNLGTLDDCMIKYAWQDIDFIKIDAEGEEKNILKGGQRFFTELSPLVQYELKEGGALHLELIQQFAELGYQSYRLVSGLNVLIPFDSQETADGYLINLFCCKPDRAEQLAANGFLVPWHQATTLPNIIELKKQTKYAWQATIGQLPYGKELYAIWVQLPMNEQTFQVNEALSCYALSQDKTLTAIERFAALKESFELFNDLYQNNPQLCSNLASFARVAIDYGARTLAVNALQQLAEIIFQQHNLYLNQPFLVPSSRFDSIAPNARLGNWILAATLEQFESQSYFSSFYSGRANQQLLEIFESLGFASVEMSRRLDLIKKRYAL